MRIILNNQTIPTRKSNLKQKLSQAAETSTNTTIEVSQAPVGSIPTGDA